MEFRRINLKCLWLAVGLALGGPCWASAQSAAPQERPIQFSSPDSGDDAAESPSLINKPAPLPDFSGAPQSSSSVFDFGAPQMTEPLPRPQIFQPSQQQRDAVAAKKDWILMTPEEILGVKTPEQMMGVTERDAAGREKKLTPLERYWDRQNQNPAYGPATNGYSPANALGQMNFLDSQNIQPAVNQENLPAARTLETKSIWNQLLNSSPDMDAARQAANAGSIWQKLMGTVPNASVISGPDPAKLADMERFRQLLGSAAPPSALPSSLPVAAAPMNSLYAPADSTVDPILGELKVNPAGASFAPLSSGIGVPAGLGALPGLTAPRREASATTTTPSSQLQNPPWVMNGPGLFTPPQRKF